jgi:hypothetical protein
MSNAPDPNVYIHDPSRFKWVGLLAALGCMLLSACSALSPDRTVELDTLAKSRDSTRSAVASDSAAVASLQSQLKDEVFRAQTLNDQLAAARDSAEAATETGQAKLKAADQLAEQLKQRVDADSAELKARMSKLEADRKSAADAAGKLDSSAEAAAKDVVAPASSLFGFIPGGALGQAVAAGIATLILKKTFARSAGHLGDAVDAMNPLSGGYVDIAGALQSILLAFHKPDDPSTPAA